MSLPSAFSFDGQREGIFMGNLSGKVYSPLAIDKTLTQEYKCADAKATGDAINELREEQKTSFNTNVSLGANINAQGGCHYIEGNGFVVMHLLVNTGADISAGHTIATLPSLQKDMVKTINIACITADGLAYPFDFEGKVISARTTIPKGKTIPIDMCMGLA